MRTISVLLLLSVVSACSTPRTVMKNPETGQVEQCGGSATGSLLAGVIGYQIQKSNDRRCVDKLQKQGFDSVKTEDR